MPLDGATYWRPGGWTIRVGLDSACFGASRHWSAKKRRVFLKLVTIAGYAAIDAIQYGHLYERNDQAFHRGSWIAYYFRRDHLERRTILITVYRFRFFGPDEPDGRHAPLPVNLLTMRVSGSGRRYTIDRIEGIMPLPRPPAQNRIVSLLNQLSRKGGDSGYLDIVGKPTPDGRTRRISVSVGGTKNAFYYSPRGLNGGGRVLLELDSLYSKGSIPTTLGAGPLTQLRQALSGIGLRKAKQASHAGPRMRSSAEDGFTYSVVLRNASAWPSTVAQSRLQLQNRPMRT